MTPGGLWVYLSTSPLLWLTVTLLAWIAADALSHASGRHPLCNPVPVAVLLVAALLWLTGTGYGVYFEGAQFVHFLLGPATVALAVPLYRDRVLVRRNLLPMIAALVAGSATAIGSALVFAVAFGLPHDIVVSLATKSATTPVAMAVTEQFGGNPSLTAALVITTGIVGAIVVTPMMNALGIRDYAARGFAAGLASHGVGTARAFVVHPIAGTFAGVAMGLNALATSLLVPVLLRWFGLA